QDISISRDRRRERVALGHGSLYDRFNPGRGGGACGRCEAGSKRRRKGDHVALAAGLCRLVAKRPVEQRLRRLSGGVQGQQAVTAGAATRAIFRAPLEDFAQSSRVPAKISKI